jgi:hypothetical protein
MSNNLGRPSLTAGALARAGVPVVMRNRSAPIAERSGVLIVRGLAVRLRTATGVL